MPIPSAFSREKESRLEFGMCCSSFQDKAPPFPAGPCLLRY